MTAIKTNVNKKTFSNFSLLKLSESAGENENFLLKKLITLSWMLIAFLKQWGLIKSLLYNNTSHINIFGESKLNCIKFNGFNPKQ